MPRPLGARSGERITRTGNVQLSPSPWVGSTVWSRMTHSGQIRPVACDPANGLYAAQTRHSGRPSCTAVGWATAVPVDAQASAGRNFLFHMEQEYAVRA